MYSTRQQKNDPYGGLKIETPGGHYVAVSVLRERGCKVSLADLAATEPFIGYLRRFDPGTEHMAYRIRGELNLYAERNGGQLLAKLFSPEFVDWNQDGIIMEGWTLERTPDTQRLQQVIQLWWIRPLEPLEIRPAICLKKGEI